MYRTASSRALAAAWSCLIRAAAPSGESAGWARAPGVAEFGPGQLGWISPPVSPPIGSRALLNSFPRAELQHFALISSHWAWLGHRKLHRFRVGAAGAATPVVPTPPIPADGGVGTGGTDDWADTGPPNPTATTARPTRIALIRSPPKLPLTPTDPTRAIPGGLKESSPLSWQVGWLT